MSQRQRRAARQQQAARSEPPVRCRQLRAHQALAIPFFFTLVLVGFSGPPAVREHSGLLWSFWGAAAALLAWTVILLATVRPHGGTLAVRIELRKQHYLQACAQSAVLLYWGWYWREVYAAAGLIAAQLAFAYAFDALLTWGPEIARTQLLPPYIYPLIFLVALPGQFLFGVASMTLAAVATTYVFGVLFFAFTGVYYFFEPSIPIAVFLGMHLLFTDPSTSPRTDLGRVMFGVLYGLSVIVVKALLVWVGAPPFYDKLLPVPILNLTIQAIDRAARSNLLARFDPAKLMRYRSPHWRYAAYIAVWAVVFTAIQIMTATPVALARADIQMSEGRIDDAIASYRDVLRKAPDHTAAGNKLGFALMQAGRLDEAHVTLRRALDVDGNDAITHNNLGLVLMQSGRAADAIVSFKRAVELQPDYAEAHYNLAHTYSSLGQPSAAVAEFRDALRLR